MKKVIVIILLLVLIAGGVLWATKAYAMERISGTWYVELDMSEQLVSSTDMLEDIPLENMMVPFVVRFEDGIYTMELDREKLPGALVQIRSDIGSTMINSYQDQGVAFLEKYLKKAGLKLNLDALLKDQNLSLERLVDMIFQLTGMSYDAILEDSLSNEMLTELFGQAEVSGRYAAIWSMLYVSLSPDEKYDTKNYLNAVITENDMIIGNGTMQFEQLPLTFHR